MNRQTIIALGAAVVLGLLAVFFANTYLNGKERQAIASGTTKVAVATAPLGYGTGVTED
jgi:pilus assembly protein CpaB